MIDIPLPPFRRQFDAARDPLTARNALGIIGTGGGGGGAPTTAQYITSAADATLTAERVLTDTATVTWDFGTAGQAKANVVGGGNVSNSGTPTAGQYAKWVTSTTIQGVAPATVLSDIGAQPAGSYQPLDGDLTALAALAGTNTIYYRSATDTWSAVTIGTGLSFASGTLSASSAGAGTVTVPQGRLTLQAGTPVMTTTQSAKTTIFYTPYQGNSCPIYDGSNFTMTAFSELSQTTTDTTKSPAAVAASSVYDLFVWNDSGTIRCTRGPAWTSDTARSVGTALTLVNGIYLNNASITNGPAASRGTYVGTVRSNASSQIDWIYGASAANGTAGFFGLWNCYNRIDVATVVQDNSASWTYTTATWRATHGSATMRVSWVVGLAEDWFYGAANAVGSNTTPTRFAAGVGIDSTSAPTGSTGTAGTATTGSMSCDCAIVPALGFHFASSLEWSNASGTTTWIGQNATNDSYQGFYFRGRF